MTLDDLKNYEANVYRAIEGSYRGRKVWTTGAPTSGPVLIAMLNVLEGYSRFIEEGLNNVTAHRVVESLKRTFFFLL